MVRGLNCSEKAFVVGAEETGLRGGRLCVGSAVCVDGGGCFSVIIQKRPHHGGEGAEETDCWCFRWEIISLVVIT